MTDAKMEALRQSLQYHYNAQTPYGSGPQPKKATPEQVIATAKKFEAFLDKQRGK